MKNTIISINTQRNVAVNSPDHIVPWGTRRDNSINKRFNYKLYKLFSHLKRPLKILDLGCSGGGFVKNCVDDGCLAVGLEGSDYSQQYNRAEWRTIPEFLFCCDITADFEVLMTVKEVTQIIKFDVVTAWDVLEHITEDDLALVINNVKKHLLEGGIWIVSISTKDDIIAGINLHQTVHSKKWWLDKFKEYGFFNSEEHVRYFNTQFIRGPKYNAPYSFHLVLTLDQNHLPHVPRENISERLKDMWFGSCLQRKLKGLLIGE